VAVIDTGAYEGHEQLRGRRLEGDRGWFDPRNGSPRPHDSDGHGTAVLSLAVGGNPDGREVGIAPGARWAAAAANWRNFYSRWRMSEAADWVLRVARPDVLINAWSHEEEGCAGFDRPFIDAWKAAEIFVVFPVGNSGPAPGSGETPGILGGTLPDGGPVLSVAALTPDATVHPRSSRGPSPCGSPGFPSLGAPGADLPHAALGSPSAYGSGTGTSLAAAVLGGGAALLLEAVPEATPEELERALLATARDLPPPGRDNESGAGALDLEAALKRLR
jgi:subtilisin family serine protease